MSLVSGRSRRDCADVYVDRHLIGVCDNNDFTRRVVRRGLVSSLEADSLVKLASLHM